MLHRMLLVVLVLDQRRRKAQFLDGHTLLNLTKKRHYFGTKSGSLLVNLLITNYIR